MFDKRVLIVPALVVSTVVAGTIYLSSDKNTSQLSVSADPVSYSVTIDVNNPLLRTQSDTVYAFRLHNAGAYSALKAPNSEAISTTNLPEKYKDYLFSFTTQSRTFFSMKITGGEYTDYEIGGVKQTLWGIPHPTKVQLVYNDDGKNLTANTVPYPSDNWKKTEDLQNGDKSISYTIINSSRATTSWDTSIDAEMGGTIYVRSMTIEYTC